MSWKVTAVQVAVCVVLSSLGTRQAHAADGDLFRMSAPWGWRCDEGRCVKEEAAGKSDLLTFNTCKLTCDLAGVLWPRPSQVNITGQLAYFLPQSIVATPTCQARVCSLIDGGIAIFKKNLHFYHPDYENGSAPWTGDGTDSIRVHAFHLDVTIASAEIDLTYDTNEAYDLSVTSSSNATYVVILAETYFGARHALETLSQLIAYHETSDSLMVVSASVWDEPAFPHRGISLDTSRNFVSVSTLERTLDTMAANKLNTLHWHITDSHSFPLVIDSLPNMAYYGAYSARQAYTSMQVRSLVQYARVRGVRLLPEIDAPAHVGNGWQWGEKEGLGRLAVCVNQEPWQELCLEPPCGQLNLANPAMYDVLFNIYEAIVDYFSPVSAFHFGGDEVHLNCWNSTDEIFNWMEGNGFGVDADAYYDQWQVFQDKAQELFKEAMGGKSVPGILWTSHLTEPSRLGRLNSSEYIIQIWTEWNSTIIAELLTQGYRVIFSNYDAWYLDCGMGAWVGEGFNWCSPYKPWQTIYDNSPHGIAINLTGSAHADLILGGEAALWTEQADDVTIDAKLWPRAAALAERLWTNPDTTWRSAETRFIHHRQRLVERGVKANRVQPQWCHQNEGLCYLL